MPPPEPAPPGRIEWIDEPVDPAGPADEAVRRSSRGSAGRLLALLLLTVLGGWWTSSGPSSDAGETDSSELEAFPDVEIASLSDSVDLDRGALEALQSLGDLGLDLDLVVTSPTSTRARLVSAGATGEVRVVGVSGLHDFAFDASGRWLAALSYQGEDRRRVLWTGTIAGGFEPVAVGVGGFAWHETEPGLLAWSNDGAIGILDVAEHGVDTIELALDADLTAWNGAGFVVEIAGGSGVGVLVDGSGGIRSTELSAVAEDADLGGIAVPGGLLVIRQEPIGSESVGRLLLVTETGSSSSVVVPDFFDGRERISAVAVG